MIIGETDLLEEAKNGTIPVEPDVGPLADFLGLLDTFSLWFNVVEPQLVDLLRFVERWTRPPAASRHFYSRQSPAVVRKYA